MEITNADPKILASRFGLWINNLAQIGRSLTYERPARAYSAKCVGAVSLGFMTYLGGGFIKNTNVGRFVCCADAMIGAPEHPTNWLSVHPFQYGGGYFKDDPAARVWESNNRFKGNSKVTHIGNDVWIGQNVIICQGVTIADGAIVAANAVVTRDVGPYEIVAGVPAKVIRTRFPQATIDRLLDLKWWNFVIPAGLGVPYTDVESALSMLEDLKASGSIDPLNPEICRISKTGKSYMFELGR